MSVSMGASMNANMSAKDSDYGYVSDLLGNPVDSFDSDDHFYENVADANDYANYSYDEYADAYAKDPDFTQQEYASDQESVPPQESQESQESQEYSQNSAHSRVAVDAQKLLDGLNPQQSQAVQYDGPALLIGAGAGSGKTRVLTRRIAWILSQKGAWPSQILAITFTNKAAAEMRERLSNLIGSEANTMWVSTFHSACVKILRRSGQYIGLKSGFSIYDTSDLSLIHI